MSICIPKPTVVRLRLGQPDTTTTPVSAVYFHEEYHYLATAVKNALSLVEYYGKGTFVELVAIRGEDYPFLAGNVKDPLKVEEDGLTHAIASYREKQLRVLIMKVDEHQADNLRIESSTMEDVNDALIRFMFNKLLMGKEIAMVGSFIGSRRAYAQPSQVH